MRRTGFTSAAGFVLALAAATPALAGTLTPNAPADAAAAPDTSSGARPGNVIGTGNSLPMSDRASNTGAGMPASTIAPRLPSPATDDGAGVDEYLRQARRDLNAHRTGAAQEALERAETRSLDRSTDPAAASQPDASAGVALISQALRAVGAGDTRQAMSLIDQALAGVPDAMAMPAATPTANAR